MPPLLMSVTEAADYLGRTPAFVRSLCHSGLVCANRVNGRFYLSKQALDVWLAGTQDPIDLTPVAAAMPRRMRD